MSNHSTLILVDGHSLAFRSYYAFSKSRGGGLRTSQGIPTSVCFGFLKSLLEVMSTENPQGIVITFDLATPTFRHEADVNYKADRAQTPEDFIPDLENLKQLLEALNLPLMTAPGYEADDLLGTLAERAVISGYTVKILTGDRDLFQLVDDRKKISVLYLDKDTVSPTKNAKLKEFKEEDVREKLGIPPAQVVDFKALCGDPSDRISGVLGIGKKTALDLLKQFPSLSAIYESLDQIKSSVKKKLEAGKADAFHSQKMAQIVTDVPLTLSWEDCHLRGFDQSRLIPLLEVLEFKKFLSQVHTLQKKFGGSSETLSLDFDSDRELSPENDEDLWFWSLSDTQAQKSLFSEIIQPQIIQSIEELKTLLEQEIKPQKLVSWDTETTELEPRDAQLVGIGLAWGNHPNQMAYIPLSHHNPYPLINLDQSKVFEHLRPILESSDYPKLFHNAKFDRLIFRSQGINLEGVVLDTLLASYILNPEGIHNLKDLARTELKILAPTYETLVKKGETIADIDIKSVAYYCGMDVYNTFLLGEKFLERLQKLPEQKSLLEHIEHPLEPILAEMEYMGISLDVAYLQELSKQLDQELENLAIQANKIAENEGILQFNLSSPKQLSQLLFETLQLDVKKSRKIKTGYSTDVTVLEKLQGDHPVIDIILEHRTLSKLKSTYVDALPALVRPDTHRLHTHFNQTMTGTGRLSSSQPNLQNIPIRTPFSRQIRKAFLPQSGWILLSADYSQIELRILAHLSQEPILIDAYQNHQDIHTVTAQLLFEKEEITPDERRLGKTINFGVIYGMGSQKLARSVGVTVSEAKKFIDQFYGKYRQVFSYLELLKKQAITQGYVSTLCGRRRYFQFESKRLQALKGANLEEINLEDLKGLTPNDSQLLRAAANSPIQGSSADIIKMAMIEVSQLLQKSQGKLLLQVHDELVLEIPPEEGEILPAKIKQIMENVVSLNVPLVVDIHSGKNWMEAK